MDKPALEQRIQIIHIRGGQRVDKLLLYSADGDVTLGGHVLAHPRRCYVVSWKGWPFARTEIPRVLSHIAR